MRRLAATLLALASLAATAVERHLVLVDGERFRIVDRDGLAIWQGDIVLGNTSDLVEATRLADLAGGALAPAKGTGVGTADRRWPRGPSGLFEVPYVIDTDLDGNVPPAVVSINQRLDGLFRLVPRTTQSDYVAFVLDPNDTTGACFSSVGRIGGRQVIGGSRGCSGASLAHEFGHTLGLFHEQERADRDRWITLDITAVNPSYASNYVASVNSRDIGNYDFGSLMHYGAAGFAKAGQVVMETVPPGIPIGQRDGYSRGDVDALRRLYGYFDPTIVVDTFPSGLTVVVDGTSLVTPALFAWPIGSTHSLDLPASAQVLGGVVYSFARWNSDTAGTLAQRQIITVAAGSGTLTEPAAFPAASIYTANFIRMKEVRLATSGNRTGVGGTMSADPPPATLGGVSGTFYRDRQPFTLTALPGAGAAFGRWYGSYNFSIATSTTRTMQMRGPLSYAASPAAYDFNAYFVDYPFATLTARSQDGDVLGISATVKRANGTSSSQRLPFNTVDTAAPWTAGEAATVTLAASATPFAPSVRYTLVSLTGGAAGTATLTHPAPGQASTTVVASYNKQYQPYTQVTPSCAATISLGTNSDGWVDSGATIPVTIVPAANWMVARWSGSLSGTGNSRSFVATDVPDVVAEMNVVPTPLALTSVSPARVVAGQGATLEILGQGFATSSSVFVGGVFKAASSVADTRIVVPLGASDIPASGKVVVSVQNRPTGSPCAATASATIEVLAAPSGPAIPAFDYSDLWWNAAESGWGLNLIQHASGVIFGVMYTYADNGKAAWYVMPGGAWATATIFSGALYTVSGPAYNSGTFNPSQVSVRQVGTATLNFASRDGGTFTFTIDGRQVVKGIARQSF